MHTRVRKKKTKKSARSQRQGGERLKKGDREKKGRNYPRASSEEKQSGRLNSVIFGLFSSYKKSDGNAKLERAGLEAGAKVTEKKGGTTSLSN